jgi:hypothetical protein
MDANGDRRLIASEIPASYRQVFARMLERGDADKNGRLEAREIAQAGPQLGLVAQLAARSLGIDVAAELARLPLDEREAMEPMDAYRRLNGAPATAVEIRGRVRQLLNQFDRNGDGKLVAAEAPPRMARSFERFDRDASGDLDDEELQQAAGAMARLQQSGRGRQRPLPDADQEMQQ